MAKRKNKRKKLKMPPLSLLDQAIYGFLGVCSFLLVFLLFIAPMLYGQYIPFVDEQVIAYQSRENFGFAAPFLFYVIATVASVLGGANSSRLPIFGKRGVKYGPPNYPPVYPIFMKNRPSKWVSEKKKESRRITVWMWLAGFVICLALYPLSFSGRICLTQDGIVQVYNAFNRIKAEYHPEQIETVTFDTYQPSHYHNTRGPDLNFLKDRDWKCVVNITVLGGKEYSFVQDNFREPMDPLEPMGHLKTLYPPEIITYEGTDHLHDVALDNYFTEEETKMLYELYAVPVTDGPWYIQ